MRVRKRAVGIFRSAGGWAGLTGLALMLSLAGCNKGTPHAGAGARGTVEEANATPGSAPTSRMERAGGPSGQTPAWGVAGGAPSESHERQGAEPLGGRDPSH